MHLPPSRKENSPESLGAHVICLNYWFWIGIPQNAEQRWKVCCVCLFVCFIWRGKNVAFICFFDSSKSLGFQQFSVPPQVFSNIYSLHESCVDKFCCLQIRSQIQGVSTLWQQVQCLIPLTPLAHNLTGVVHLLWEIYI